MQDFRIQISSNANDDECVAEIWLGSLHVAELLFGPSDEILIRVFGGANGDTVVLDFDSYSAAIHLARNRLAERHAPKTDTSRYEQLLFLFTSGLMSVEDFEARYFETFKSDEQFHRTGVHEVLNKLFTDLDVFNPDTKSRLEYEIDFQELMDSAKAGLRQLQALKHS